MGVTTAIISGIGVAASTAGTVYSIDQSNKQAADAKLAATRQASEQENLTLQAKRIQAETDAKKTAILTAPKPKPPEKYNASGTILTGPLGIQQIPSSGPKTLLGT